MEFRLEQARPTIFVSWPGYDPDDPQTGGWLKAAGLDVRLAPKLGARSEDELSSLMGEAVGALVSTDPFTERVNGVERATSASRPNRWAWPREFNLLGRIEKATASS